jgi:uncharacterized protein (DUF3084 family)
MLKKLKGIFVVDDGKPSKTPPASANEKEPTIEELEQSMKTTSSTSTSSSTASSTSSASSSQASVPRAEVSSKPDAKFVNVLLKAIDSNNQEGFDYLEYKQSLQNLGNVDMDEATRYQSALAMAKTMGASPASLISSAKRYIKVVDAEGAKFKQASNNQRQKQVTGKQDEIKAHEKAIKEKEAQIVKLQKEIENHKVQLEKTKSTINNAAAKVQLTTDKFMVAYNSVKGQILSDIQNMEKFLK